MQGEQFAAKIGCADDGDDTLSACTEVDENSACLDDARRALLQMNN